MSGRVAGLLVLPLLAAAQPASETRCSLSIADEAGYAAGLRVPGSRAGNLALAQPSLAWRRGDRLRFVSRLAGLAMTRDETHARLRVKETYFGFSAADLDVAIGKKILRWGVGYAFTPTGVLDPPRIPTDPTDRLDLNEGREMVAADWIRGRHALAVAWASGGLLQKHSSALRETTAVRYNRLIAGFDSAVVFARERGRDMFLGGNFTRVFGESVEIHGELARREAAAVLLGGKYTSRSGAGVIAEFYSSRDVNRPRRHYGFLRLGKSRLRELPGWKEWDVAASLVASLDDGSRVIFADVTRRVGDHFSVYGRVLAPRGSRRSEYGMIPYAALITAGVRFQL